MKTVQVVQIENGWTLTLGTAIPCFCADASEVLDKIKVYLNS